jgi:hypothetical protein
MAKGFGGWGGEAGVEVRRQVQHSNRQIAHSLVIELCTVKQPVHNILDKLDQCSRRDAARLAIERGWLAPPLWARSR